MPGVSTFAQATCLALERPILRVRVLPELVRGHMEVTHPCRFETGRMAPEHLYPNAVVARAIRTRFDGQCDWIDETRRYNAVAKTAANTFEPDPRSLEWFGEAHAAQAMRAPRLPLSIVRASFPHSMSSSPRGGVR